MCWHQNQHFFHCIAAIEILPEAEMPLEPAHSRIPDWSIALLCAWSICKGMNMPDASVQSGKAWRTHGWLAESDILKSIYRYCFHLKIDMEYIRFRVKFVAVPYWNGMQQQWRDKDDIAFLCFIFEQINLIGAWALCNQCELCLIVPVCSDDRVICCKSCYIFLNGKKYFSVALRFLSCRAGGLLFFILLFLHSF